MSATYTNWFDIDIFPVSARFFLNKRLQFPNLHNFLVKKNKKCSINIRHQFPQLLLEDISISYITSNRLFLLKDIDRIYFWQKYLLQDSTNKKPPQKIFT